MKKKDFNLRQVTLEGLMTFGQLENGQLTLDFACCETARLEPAVARCRMQVMRDGNVYITQLPRRQRNSPLFRDDNASFTRGRDGRFYFTFSLPGERVAELPAELVRQASAIARKVMMELI